MTLAHRIPEEPVVGKPLGRHVEHDPRSRSFGLVAAAVPLRNVHHRRYGGPLDQGDLGSCTGNAVAGAVNTSPLHTPKKRLLRESDAVAIYTLATTLDAFAGEYPPTDTGSSGLAAAKAARQLGHISAYRHAFGIDEALQALMVAPVITGVDWYESFDRPDARGRIEIAGQVRGGHEFEVLGYEHRSGSAGDAIVFCVNSWGLGYGRRGRFTMTVSTWAALLAAQGDVTVLVR